MWKTSSACARHGHSRSTSSSLVQQHRAVSTPCSEDGAEPTILLSCFGNSCCVGRGFFLCRGLVPKGKGRATAKGKLGIQFMSRGSLNGLLFGATTPFSRQDKIGGGGFDGRTITTAGFRSRIPHGERPMMWQREFLHWRVQWQCWERTTQVQQGWSKLPGKLDPRSPDPWEKGWTRRCCSSRGEETFGSAEEVLMNAMQVKSTREWELQDGLDRLKRLREVADREGGRQSHPHDPGSFHRHPRRSCHRACSCSRGVESVARSCRRSGAREREIGVGLFILGGINFCQ